eukprot:CAMPEP_0170548954 /NCGR_PEP_ID=MMETSP0211-20121228/7125_1 /TAXON_ID=311385 /ORGANISM="Pseudokeronopsis sp., Strain OXSARD2" /LENGTH=66 /DNA_ID=CAMNT_0010854689 /DNA_START=123 /DNA_END=323 /DNA_ORIENTATION=+
MFMNSQVLPDEDDGSFLMEKIYEEEEKLQMDTFDIDDEKKRKENESLMLDREEESMNQVNMKLNNL